MTHSPKGFDWDDLKHLLAVARHGSTLAAGRALGVDQSTVQRRLVELERRIGQSLVQRQPTGYRLTEFGQEMLPFAEAVERSVQAFERQLHTLGTETAGVIRLTCPEPIVNRITQAGLLDRFHARHPALRVQFVMSDKYVDLSQGDADVALRSGDTDDDELVGRKIGDSDLGGLREPDLHRASRPTREHRGPRQTCVGRLRRHDGQASHRPMAAQGGAGCADGRTQQQRSRPGLFGQGGHRHRAPAPATRRRGARSREGAGTGGRTDADLAPAHDARVAANAACERVLRLHRRARSRRCGPSSRAESGVPRRELEVFLPSFKGAKPYLQAHDRGVKLIGATAHYVTADLDEPNIEQRRAGRSRLLAEDFTAVGRNVESIVLARCALAPRAHVLLNGPAVVFADDGSAMPTRPASAHGGRRTEAQFYDALQHGDIAR